MEDVKYDVIVIGGGPGGYSAAVKAAELGKRVALVEGDALGGVCLNRGCIPTKAMLASSGLFQQVRKARAFGVVTDGARVDYPAVMKRRDGVIAHLASGLRFLLASKKITIIPGRASFVSPEAVSVTGADGQMQLLSFGAAVIATGSAPVRPSFLPDSPRILDSDGFLKLETLPQNLLILGGGVIGCEFATMAAQFGASVTIVEMAPGILPAVDADVRRVLMDAFGELGVKVIVGAALEDVEADENGVYGMAGDEEVFGDVLLVAAGRRPVTEGLRLAEAGVAFGPRGIAVDEHCRTSVQQIYAAGDVADGSSQLAHGAMEQGRVAALNICGGEATCAGMVPACVFTDPEIALAGLTEEAAAKAGIRVRAEKSFFAHNGKACASGETRGFVKKIFRDDNGALAGVEIVGLHATELISAVAGEVCPGFPLPHPTLAEALI